MSKAQVSKTVMVIGAICTTPGPMNSVAGGPRGTGQTTTGLCRPSGTGWRCWVSSPCGYKDTGRREEDSSQLGWMGQPPLALLLKLALQL